MQPNWTNPHAGKNVKERMGPLFASGMTQAQVARALNVSGAAVCRAVQRSKRPPGKNGRPRKEAI